MKKSSAIAIIIMGLSALVNAASKNTIDGLIAEAISRGENTIARPDQSEYAGIPQGAPGKALEVEAKDSSDGATHDFIVYLKNGKPVVTLFTNIRKGIRSDEYVYLGCDTKGKLGMCYNGTGEKDAAGNPIAGSAKIIALNPKEGRTKAALRHEMDFWLRGLFRKPVGAKASKKTHSK